VAAAPASCEATAASLSSGPGTVLSFVPQPSTAANAMSIQRPKQSVMRIRLPCSGPTPARRRICCVRSKMGPTLFCVTNSFLGP
jgi:hypothetical protein